MYSDKLYKWLYKGLKKPSFHFPEHVELKFSYLRRTFWVQICYIRQKVYIKMGVISCSNYPYWLNISTVTFKNSSSSLMKVS